MIIDKSIEKEPIRINDLAEQINDPCDLSDQVLEGLVDRLVVMLDKNITSQVLDEKERRQRQSGDFTAKFDEVDIADGKWKKTYRQAKTDQDRQVLLADLRDAVWSFGRYNDQLEEGRYSKKQREAVSQVINDLVELSNSGDGQLSLDL